MHLYKAILKQYGSSVTGGVGSFSHIANNVPAEAGL